MSAIAAEIERLAFRAWPAVEEEDHEGWMLRRSPGLPARRINSATSPAHAPPGLAGIDAVINAWYRRRDATPIVRILSVSPPEIDRHFAARGWPDESPTAVMTKRLEARIAGTPRAAVSLAASDRWLAAKQWMSGMADDTMDAWVHRASAIEGCTAFASIEARGNIAAIGLGVLADGWLGVFDVQTVPDRRRRGLATEIVETLEATAMDRGATAAYLQVEMGNVQARALYARGGYADVYHYRYRRALE